MASCNNNGPCGRSCGRQDNHGGDCNCYEENCMVCPAFWTRTKRTVHEAQAAVPTTQPLMVLYAVRRGNTYYRARAGNRCAEWVEDIASAKYWGTPGPAKGVITRNSGDRSETPELVELVVTEARVVNQKSRVEAAKAKKEREEVARRLERRQRELEAAQRDLVQAQARLVRLGGG